MTPEPYTPGLSIVVPVHDEAPIALPLAREVAEAFGARAFERLFVDDGSADASVSVRVTSRSSTRWRRGRTLCGRSANARQLLAAQHVEGTQRAHGGAQCHGRARLSVYGTDERRADGDRLRTQHVERALRAEQSA